MESYNCSLSPNTLSYNIYYHIRDYIPKEKEKEVQNKISGVVSTWLNKHKEEKKANSPMSGYEFVTLIPIKDKLVAVGLDDYGQSYFIVYNENGELKEESCGSYNSDYKGYIEWRFGEPSMCPEYDKKEECKLKDKGYCDKCERSDPKWFSMKKLIDLGIIDRRGNVLEPYTDFIIQKEDE